MVTVRVAARVLPALLKTSVPPPNWTGLEALPSGRSVVVLLSTRRPLIVTVPVRPGLLSAVSVRLPPESCWRLLVLMLLLPLTVSPLVP